MSSSEVHACAHATLWWRLYRNGVLVGRHGLLCVSRPMDEAVIDEALERWA